MVKIVETEQKNRIFTIEAVDCYQISVRDWGRLRASVASIAPKDLKIDFSSAGYCAAGVAASAIFSLIAIANSTETPNWVWITNICVLVVSLILVPSFFFLFAAQKRCMTGNTAYALVIMDELIADMSTEKDEGGAAGEPAKVG